MAPRARIFAFGSMGLLVVAGALCAALVAGLTGQVLAIGFITVGLGGALLLVFLEVGLSEERQLARDEARRRKLARRHADARSRPRLPRWPRRPG